MLVYTVHVVWRQMGGVLRLFVNSLNCFLCFCSLWTTAVTDVSSLSWQVWWPEECVCVCVCVFCLCVYVCVVGNGWRATLVRKNKCYNYPIWMINQETETSIMVFDPTHIHKFASTHVSGSLNKLSSLSLSLSLYMHMHAHNTHVCTTVQPHTRACNCS